MYPADFDYRRAGTLEEALELLREHGSDARLLAGGQSLLPLMKLRLARPGVLVDIGRIPDLSGVRRSDGTIAVGALTTHTELERSELLQAELPLVSETAALVGDRQIRNRGTWGGNLAHADPSSDPPATFLALDGVAVAARAGGSRREIPAGEFISGMFQTALRPEEMLVEIRFPAADGGRAGWAYQKVAHPASRYAVVGLAASLRVGEDGKLERVRLGITGAGTHARRASQVEQALEGQSPEASLIQQAAELAPEGIDLRGDAYASAEFRAHLLRVHAERALTRALERAVRG